MRRAFRLYLPGSLVSLLLLGIQAPSAPAVAQDAAPPEETCPEGLVYDAAGDICVLPEDTPGDEPADPGEQPVDEPVDEEAMPTEAPMDDTQEPVVDPVEEPPPADDTQPVMDEPAQDAPAPESQIGNITLATYSCPASWDPALRGIEASREMCVESTVTGVTYTISFAGRAIVTAGIQDDVDLAASGAALPVGQWTIQEMPQAGLAEPFASCAILAVDGMPRSTLQQVAPGGKLDIMLAEGEQANCEWFSIAAMPGDPGQGPSLGIFINTHVCPAGWNMDTTQTENVQTCTLPLPLPAPVTIEFSKAGQLVDSQTATAQNMTVSASQNGALPDAGEWMYRALVPDGWAMSTWYCLAYDASNQVVTDIVTAPQADPGLVRSVFSPNQKLVCDIFLIPAGGAGFVDVTAYTCPAGFDPANPAAGDRLTACARTQRVPFDFQQNDLSIGTRQTAANGVAAAGPFAGQARIASTPPAGTVLLFVTCDITSAGQIQTLEPTINADGASVTIAVATDNTAACAWFFGPPAAPASDAASLETGGDTAPTTTGDTPDTGEAPASNTQTQSATFGGGTALAPAPPAADSGTANQPAAAATSSLSVQIWDCTIPVATASTDELTANCTESTAPSSWQLNGQPLETGAGLAEWTGLEPGSVSVTNLAAASRDDAASAVSCSVGPVTGEALVGIDVLAKGGVVELMLNQPAIVHCAWYVAP